MERGNTKHGRRDDDALAEQVRDVLAHGGSNREERTSGESPVDDGADPAVLPELPAEEPRDAVGG
ncbi:MAG: hypothetical protein ACT4RN_10230 [Pseudonocardia sp.]